MSCFQGEWHLHPDRAAHSACVKLHRHTHRCFKVTVLACPRHVGAVTETVKNRIKSSQFFLFFKCHDIKYVGVVWIVTVCETCVNCPRVCMDHVGGSSETLPSLSASNPVAPSPFFSSSSHLVFSCLCCLTPTPRLLLFNHILPSCQLFPAQYKCPIPPSWLCLCVCVCLCWPVFVVSAFRSELSCLFTARTSSLSLMLLHSALLINK